MVSVFNFAADNKETIKNMYGYASMLKDLKSSNRRTLKPFIITEDMVGKRILANHYGHACEWSLCIFFKKYAVANTDYVVGYQP